MLSTIPKATFSEWEKTLPQSLTSETELGHCWNFIKSGIRQRERDTHAQPLLLMFAHARDMSIVQNLSSLENATTFEKLLLHLEDQYLPLIVLLFERLKFYRRIREDNESIEEYLDSLESLGDICDFGKGKNEAVRAQFVQGGKLPLHLKQLAETSTSSSLSDIILFYRGNEVVSQEDFCAVMGKSSNSPTAHKNLSDGTRKGREEDWEDSCDSSGKNFRRSRRIALYKSKQQERSLKNDKKIKKVTTKTVSKTPVKRRNFRAGSETPRSGSIMKNVQTEILTPKMSLGSSKIKCRKSSQRDNNQTFQTLKWEGRVTDDCSNCPPRIPCNTEGDITKACITDDKESRDIINKTPKKVKVMNNIPNSKEPSSTVLATTDDQKQNSSSTFALPLKTHMDYGNKVSESVECKICGEFFSQQVFYEVHINVHCSECAICGKILNNPSQLSSHIFQHKQLERNSGERRAESLGGKKGRQHEEYTCSECHIKIYGKRLFNRHMNQHNLYCDICDKMIDCKSTFIIHMNGHRGERPYPCDSCPRSFTRKSDLKVHRLTHDPNRQKHHVCDICGKKFFRIHELERHRKLHSDDKPYQCDTCSKSFPTAHGLKCHQFLHTGIKTFTCEKCGVSFAQKSNLATHLMRHSGIKEHSCKTCGLRFARKCYLESHMRSHTKEKPFVCDVCGACVSSRYSLQRHKLVHSEKKPHKCMICNKAFTWQSTYKKHMESHGNTQFVKDLSNSDNLSCSEPVAVTRHHLSQKRGHEPPTSTHQTDVLAPQTIQNTKHLHELTEHAAGQVDITAHSDLRDTQFQYHQDCDSGPVQEQALNLQLGQKFSSQEGYVNQSLQVYLPQQESQSLYGSGLHLSQNPILEVHPQNLVASEPEYPQVQGSQSHTVHVLRAEEPMVYNWVIQGTSSSAVFEPAVLEVLGPHEGAQ